MVTASHNPNGWTGVKMGFEPPLTHGPEEMAGCATSCSAGAALRATGRRASRVEGVRDGLHRGPRRRFRLSRPLRVVCATGNGTAGAFAPEILARIGAEVIPRHTELD